MMSIVARHVCALTALALLTACVSRDRVELTVDFTARDTWSYDFALSVGGRAVLGDSVSAFSNELRCRLTGQGDSSDPTLLHVKAESVSVEPGLLDEGEADNMRRLLEEFEVSFSLREGFVGLDDSVSIPIVKVGHWDLYRHIVKMLPLLPQGQVRPGFAWERQKQIPLLAHRDGAVGDLYQSFRFDSLTKDDAGHRRAHLSWSFSYAVDAEADTSRLLDDMPHKGSGTGSALLDVDRKLLREASVEFTVPEGEASDMFSVEWKEEAKLSLVH